MEVNRVDESSVSEQTRTLQQEVESCVFVNIGSSGLKFVASNTVCWRFVCKRPMCSEVSNPRRGGISPK